MGVGEGVGDEEVAVLLELLDEGGGRGGGGRGRRRGRRGRRRGGHGVCWDFLNGFFGGGWGIGRF